MKSPDMITQYSHLVLLASGGRGFDQLLQDFQAHESDVLHHNRSLDVNRHEEQTKSWGKNGLDSVD